MSRPSLFAGLHLAALSSFAFAQPLFDLLGRSAEFFAVRDSTRWDVVAFAVGSVVVPPLAIISAEFLASRVDRRVARWLHLVAVGALVALVLLQVARRTGDPPGAVVFPSVALAGAAAALGYARLAPVRSFLSVLSPAPLVFLALFLFGSPASKLVLGREPEPRLAAVEARTPVFLVVFDELSTVSLLDERGDIDAARYPNFAALAGASTWFRNAATVDAWTTNAVPAILTGRYPQARRLPTFSEHPDNLFTLLGGRYRLRVFESLTRLCPARLCPGARGPFRRRMESLLGDAGVLYLHTVFPPDVRAHLPPVTDTWGAFLESSSERTRRRLGLFRSFLSSLEPGHEPTLGFAHVMFPHVPWEFLPSGRSYDGDDLPGFERIAWGDDPFLVEQAYQRYLLQLQFADRLVGELVRRLKAVGVYDRALLIVLADHGVSFRPGERRRAFTEANLEDVVFMPLFVKRPGQKEGRTVDRPVQTIDVLPTIAYVLGVDVPWRVDGSSLFSSRRASRFVFLADGERLTKDAASLLARRDRALERQLALFGSGSRRPGLYGIGPHRELLDKPVGSLDVSPAGSGKAEIDQAGDLRSVDLASPHLPARLTGRISGDGAGPRDLAIGLNGRIVAVARSFDFEGEERLSVLVPEVAFRQGENDLRVFWVRPGSRLVGL